MTGDAKIDATTLVAVHAEGDAAIHLAVASAAQSLCARRIARDVPGSSYRRAGCRPCLEVAKAAGHSRVLDGNLAWTNLQRLSPESLPEPL